MEGEGRRGSVRGKCMWAVQSGHQLWLFDIYYKLPLQLLQLSRLWWKSNRNLLSSYLAQESSHFGKTRSKLRRNTSIWVLTSFVFLTSFRFMSSFAFLNFFVGLTSLDFELFWCLMLFVLFCCLTSLVLCTLSKKCVRLLTFFYRNFFVPFYFCFQVHSVFMFCVFMELFQILLWHHFRTLILIGRGAFRWFW